MCPQAALWERSPQAEFQTLAEFPEEQFQDLPVPLIVAVFLGVVGLAGVGPEKPPGATGAPGRGIIRIGCPFGPAPIPGRAGGAGISLTSTSSISKIRSALGGYPDWRRSARAVRASHTPVATE